MQRPLRIAHLYPDLLNLYADQGNIQVLRKRCEWRNIDVEVIKVPSGEFPDLRAYDLVLLGGGSDREQELVGRTLRAFADDWRVAIEDGLPLLAVCGGYQLLGEYYQVKNGEKIRGLGLLDMVTVPGDKRLIGNISIESTIAGVIMGFENHAGYTSHAYEPLGRVLSGHGNNDKDQTEGVRYRNIYGTYIHGPLLPKNPVLADHVLQAALDYAGIHAELSPLEDELEVSARLAFTERRLI